MIAPLFTIGWGVCFGLASYTLWDQWKRGGRPWRKARPYIKPEILRYFSLKRKIPGLGICLGPLLLLWGISSWGGPPECAGFGFLWINICIGWILAETWYAKRRGTLIWIWTKREVV